MRVLGNGTERGKKENHLHNESCEEKSAICTQTVPDAAMYSEA